MKNILILALLVLAVATGRAADTNVVQLTPALVNALAMMSPYGTPEKQALLEAPNLKARAEILVAVTEMDLAKKTAGGGEPPLQ